MLENKLVVIGNGFDVFHDIKSSYWNFKEYLGEVGQEGFVRAIENYISSDELWSSFEYALGCLDYETLKEDNSCYLLDYGDDNWRDSAHHDYQMMISEELNFSKDIPNYLRQWILSLDTCKEKKIGSRVINPSNIFISFNYTDTLEQTYSINRERILYIHGKAKEHYKLIVGHGDTSMIVDTASKEFFSEEEREAYMDYMQGADVRELEAQEIIRGYFSSTYKDVDAIIKCNDIFFRGLYGIKQVFILGHSLADVDLPYFALLNSVLGQNVYWIVTYYREWEREEFIRRLSSVGISWHYIKMCRMEELEY